MKDIKLSVGVGEDRDGKFLAHKCDLGYENAVDNYRINITKRYYKTVEIEYIKNMPIDEFYDLLSKMKDEEIRRKDECHKPFR